MSSAKFVTAAMSNHRRRPCDTRLSVINHLTIKEKMMAWEISISAEGWTEIRERLDTWNRDNLISAIADDKFELVYGKADQHHAERAASAERNRLAGLPHDLLADRAFELIQQNNTCDNGGWAYWIDREGYHKVNLN